MNSIPCRPVHKRRFDFSGDFRFKDLNNDGRIAETDFPGVTPS